MRKKKWWLVAAAVLVAGMIGGVVQFYAAAFFYGSPAEARARTYFGIPRSTEVSAESIRAALLQAVPIGSTEAEVQKFVDGTDIGKDKLSCYFKPDKQGRAVIQIFLDPQSFKIVHTHYAVILQFDTNLTLQTVEVNEFLTGP